MQTPVIISSASAPQGAKPAVKQADDNGGDASFNQMLSQQIADRRVAENAGKTRAPSNPKAPDKVKEPNKVKETDKPQETAADAGTQGKVSEAGEPDRTAAGTAAADEEKPAGDQVSSAAAVDVAVAPLIINEMLALVANTQAITGSKPQTTSATAESVAQVADAAAGKSAAPALALDVSSGTGAELAKAETPLAQAQGTDLLQSGDAAGKSAAGKAAPDFKASLAEARDRQPEAAQAKAETSDKPVGLAAALNATQQNSSADKAQQKLTDLSAAKTGDVQATANAMPQIQQAAVESARAATTHASDRLAPQVGTPGWDQALGQKVVWMVAGAQQSASLTLNPPDLGPLQVVLNVSNGQADASFFAAQPEVRQALEAALPKLRDMMSEAGVQLGQTTVSAGMPNQHNQPGEQQASRNYGQDNPASEAVVSGARQTVVGGQGLVDTFA